MQKVRTQKMIIWKIYTNLEMYSLVILKGWIIYMRRRWLLTIVSLSMVLGLAGCGGETEKADETGNKAENVSGEVNDNTTGSTDEVNENKDNQDEDLLAEYLNKFNPTYKASNADGSAYYFTREEITLDKKMSEIENVKKYVATIRDVELDKTVRGKDFFSWEELKNSLVKNENTSMDIVFEDDEYFDVNISSIASLETYVTYEEIEEDGGFSSAAIELTKLEWNNEKIDIGSYFGVETDEKKSTSEQLLELKEIWGEPSMIVRATNYRMASIIWCFEETAIQFDIGGGDEVDVNYIYLSWADYESTYEEQKEWHDRELLGNPNKE